MIIDITSIAIIVINVTIMSTTACYLYYCYFYYYYYCQTVLRNALKSSANSDINSMWAKTSFGCIVQYDQYKNTKQVVTAIQKDNESRNTHELKSQGFVISSILTRASSKTLSLWFSAQQSMPKSIFKFSVKYLNNTCCQEKYM